MNVSKLTLTDEFMSKLKSNLNQREKSALRDKRLKELDESGELQTIKTRFELGLACGYTKQDYAKINSWVCYKVERGVLTETLLGLNDKGRAEYEYHYHNVPKKQPEIRQTIFSKPKSEISPLPYEVEMTTGSLSVKLKLHSLDEVINIMKSMEK